MIDGFVAVDKPAGWTSHDVVARCRRVFGQKKVGHSGTLDPDATGVLLVGLGRATRLLRFLTELPKTYTGEVVLGVATSTLDASGKVTGEWDLSGVTLGDVRAAAAGFVGEIEQVPPMVSAVSVGGKRLHELARAGVEVERAARRVTVHELRVEPGSDPQVVRIEVRCSSGTYIRTLAADLGAALGGGAHLRNLRRTAVGSFTAEAAVPLDEVGPAAVMGLAESLRDHPAVAVDDATVVDIRHGKPVRLPDGSPPRGPVCVLDAEGALVAVFEDGRSAVVVPPA